MSPKGAFLTDSHCHLDYDDLQKDLDGVLARARTNGVERFMTISSRLGDLEAVVDLAERLDEVYACVGVHPHEATGWDADQARRIRALAGHPKLLAVGEMGLDYHYDNSPRDVQQQAFREQLELAHELGLPVVIHTRDADEDCARILSEAPLQAEAGVIHCFTSGADLAETCLDLGFAISFSGIVTYPSAEDLRVIAKGVPGDRLLVETDCPYLSPIPERRDWPNEPARVRHVAALLADLRGESLDDLARASSAAFERIFLPGATAA